jgi:NAD(P)-dependent dehydrogenase (short-subunit alcohol dehydrogenase family)
MQVVGFAELSLGARDLRVMAPAGMLDAVAARLCERELEVTGPTAHEGVDRSLYVSDPEGNMVEVWDFFHAATVLPKAPRRSPTTAPEALVGSAGAPGRPELHVLVHNAGIGSPGGLEDHSREQVARVMAVNAAAPLFLTQALLGPLRAAGRTGRIVIVSSDSGRFTVAKNGVAFPYRSRRPRPTCSRSTSRPRSRPTGSSATRCTPAGCAPGWVGRTRRSIPSGPPRRRSTWRRFPTTG